MELKLSMKQLKIWGSIQEKKKRDISITPWEETFIKENRLGDLFAQIKKEEKIEPSRYPFDPDRLKNQQEDIKNSLSAEQIKCLLNTLIENG